MYIYIQHDSHVRAVPHIHTPCPTYKKRMYVFIANMTLMCAPYHGMSPALTSYFLPSYLPCLLLPTSHRCAPYHGMSEEYAERLEDDATIISWIFITEMALKLVALGCPGYWSDGWNCLDGSIVTMSIVEMVLTAIFAGGGMNLSFLRILRMLRVLRVLRLMKSWKGLYKIVVTTGKALPQMVNIFILMFLILLIFSLLGMQACHPPHPLALPTAQLAQLALSSPSHAPSHATPRPSPSQLFGGMYNILTYLLTYVLTYLQPTHLRTYALTYLPRSSLAACTTPHRASPTKLAPVASARTGSRSRRAFTSTTSYRR